MKKKFINMYFATHSTCNMNCRYCYVPKTAGRRQDESDDAVLSSLDRFIAKVEAEGFALGSFCFHGTEPTLMAPETLAAASEKVYRHWAGNGISNLRVSVQTNGYNLTTEYLAILKSKLGSPDRLRLSFSIDPPKIVHDKYRNKSYDRVYSNFQGAIDQGFQVAVLSVVTPDTLDHFKEFADWMEHWLNIKEKTGNPYKLKIKSATGDVGLYGDNMVRLAGLLEEHRMLSLAQILSPGYCIQNGNECMWFEFDIHGNCYSCNKAYNENGIFADWNKECLNDIFAKRKELYSKNCQSPECGECMYEALCNSGCPLDRHYEGPMAGLAHECLLIKHSMQHIEEKGIHIVEFYNNNI